MRLLHGPCSKGVNWKSGRYFISFSFDAVFLNWPSALLLSNCGCLGHGLHGTRQGTHLVLALEPDRLDDGIGDLLDRDLVRLADGEDEWVDLLVGPEHPDEELGEVARVDELPEGRAGARDGEGRAVAWRIVRAT
jgi:hypothetical protein